MRTGTKWAAAAALCAAAYGSTARAALINEIYHNPPSTDAPNEYVEIRGTPGELLAGVYLIFLEGDSGSSNPGDVNNIFDLTSRSIGSNGFLTIRQQGSPYLVAAGTTDLVSTAAGFTGGVGFSADTGTDIENLSYTALLVHVAPGGTAPTQTLDLDAGDNGLDALPAGWTILDGVGVLDGGASDRAYAGLVFSDDADGLIEPGATLVNLNAADWEVEYVMRFGDSTGSAAADWFAADVTGTPPTMTVNFAQASQPGLDGLTITNHLGASNPVPEPASAGVVAAGAIGILARRRRRARER